MLLHTLRQQFCAGYMVCVGDSRWCCAAIQQAYYVSSLTYTDNFLMVDA